MPRNIRYLVRMVFLVLVVFVLFVPMTLGQGMTPFYGKNKVKYDKHDWRLYRSPHFEVYYYPEFEQELGRLVSYAESAYERVSNELKHEISFSIPLILYKTFSEFAQTNLFPIEIPEGVGAFAEPARDRMVIPVDNPPDELQELFIHELTHIFQFDIIPRSLIRRSVPIWIDEGMATYMEDEWDALDLMALRDAAVTDQIPTFDQLNIGFSRTPYTFGAAIFDFMEERFGKEGVRQFVFALRRSMAGGVSEEVYEQAFRMSPEEFYREYKRWLVDRFKPYRDKEIPDDYSVDLSPDLQRGKYIAALSSAVSPSKEIIAVMSFSRREQEIDIILLSAHDGSVIKSLTPGYSESFESIVGLVGEDALIVRNISWTPDGDHIVFFGKYKKRRALMVVNVLESKVSRRVVHDLDRALFPHAGPDGWVYFAALKDAIGDIYRMNLQTEELQNLTDDDFFDKFPTVTPDGEWLYYTRRISGHDKIYKLRIDNPDEREQVTFGTHDDSSPIVSDDGKYLFFSCNADDDTFNLRSLDLETKDIIQYTDVLGGNFSPVLIKDKDTNEDLLLFTSYYKGNWGLYKLAMDEPVKEITADMVARTEGPVIDFVPPVSHQIIAENKRKKGMFEKLFIDGAPPINVGVTSGGDFYGGSGISISDVLGDQNFTFVAASIREFRSYFGTYTNRSGRLQYSLSGYDTTQFFFTTPVFTTSQLYSRDDRLATIRLTGVSATAIYPISRFRRFEVSTGIYRQGTDFQDPSANPFGTGFASQDQIDYFQQLTESRFPNGTVLPVSTAFVQETTRFRNFGPIAGSTVYAGLTASPGGAFLSRKTANLDARKYFQLTTNTLFAFRFRGFYSTGEAPDFFWFGGNGEVRGYPYLAFVGNKAFFTNAEFRFPIIEAALTPIGVFGPIRGSVFFDMGGAAYNDEPFNIFTRERRLSSLGVQCGPAGFAPCISEGFGLKDTVASYGFGVGLYAFGMPFNWSFAKLTDLSTTLAEWKIDFWIGFPF